MILSIVMIWIALFYEYRGLREFIWKFILIVIIHK